MSQNPSSAEIHLDNSLDLGLGGASNGGIVRWPVLEGG
jgi:hypothetical protein